MKFILKAALGFIICLLLIPESIYGQSSLVPSYHPVYEWLYLQRVKGILPDFNYESLPLSRATILNHLQSLSESERLEGKERRTLKSFTNEFDPSHLNSDEVHSLITNDSKLSLNRFKNWAWSDNEKHLFSLNDSSGFIILDHGFGRRAMFVKDGSVNRKAPYILNQHWRTYGSYKNFIGYHAELIRAVPVGYQRIFEYDGFYSYNWKFLRNESNNNYHYEGYVTANYSFFEGSIGRGNIKKGVGSTENLAFSRSGYPSDWIRLKVGKSKVSYELIHGKPSWQSTRKPLDEDSTIFTKNSPERWYAYHEVRVKPFSWLTLSAYEMINYSNRGAEISYINPINRYAFAEWELQDQDNGWNGGYLILNLFKGVEFSTELLIDDLGNKRDIIGKKQFPANSRFARKYGLHYVTSGALQLWVEYTRIDPFIYSHFYRLNTHTDKGIGLGSQIGPNSDRLESGIKLWGVGRSFMSISYSVNRQGLDIFDDTGNKIFLAGASVLDNRSEEIAKSHLFLDGDLHEWHRFLLKGSLEPKRGYIFEVNFDMRRMIKGDQLDDLAIFWADFTIGF